MNDIGEAENIRHNLPESLSSAFCGGLPKNGLLPVPDLDFEKDIPHPFARVRGGSFERSFALIIVLGMRLFAACLHMTENNISPYFSDDYPCRRIAREARYNRVLQTSSLLFQLP
jgi:hypothetical protein